MENEPCRWTSVQRDNLVGGSLWGLNGRPLTSVPLKSGSPLSALSLCCCLKFALRETRSYTNKSSQPLTPGRVWTLNQHLVKSLKKVWSYAKGTSTSKAIRNRNRLPWSIKQHRANKQQQRTSPEWRNDNDTRGFQHPGNERQISVIST